MSMYLRTVRVLVLVDHHVAELAGVEVAGLLGGFEELDRAQEEVVEVERIGVAKSRDVALVDLGNLLVANVVGAAQGLGPFHAIAQVADARERLARRHELVVDAEIFFDLLDERDLVRRIVDDEVAGEADFRRFAPQQARAEGVESRKPHAARVVADERRDALTHLAGGLVGKRDREHVVGLGVPVADEVCNAISDDARLARARAGQDEQRSVTMQNGFTLFRIQFREEVHGGSS